MWGNPLTVPRVIGGEAKKEKFFVSFFFPLLSSLFSRFDSVRGCMAQLDSFLGFPHSAGKQGHNQLCRFFHGTHRRVAELVVSVGRCIFRTWITGLRG